MAVHLLLECRIGLGRGVGLLQLEDQRHQRLGDEAAAIDAEMPALVGAGAERIGLRHGHALLMRDLGGVKRCVGGARGADEGADLVRVLLAGRALDAGGDIDARRARDAQRLGHIAGVEPARQHERNARIEPLSSVQSNGCAEPARPRGVLRRARVEQQPVGDLRVELDRARDRLRSAIGIAFITGRPKRVRTAATRSGVSLPCSCSMSGLSASTMPASVSSSASTVSATLPARPLHALAERARGLEREIARARRKEHEADQSAPASSATSSASGVFRPQILTDQAAWPGF